MIYSDDEESQNEHPLARIDIPLSNSIMNTACNELTSFKRFLSNLISINESAQSEKISFAENMAFRLLGSMDWTNATFADIKRLLNPLANSRHIDLNFFITKEYGKFLKLKEKEAKQALHEWFEWRVKLNEHLIQNYKKKSKANGDPRRRNLFFKNPKIKKPEQPDLGSIGDIPFINDDLKEVLSIYMIAKWSSDDSSLKFNSFFHYGIPRARIRVIQTDKMMLPEPTMPNLSIIPSSSLASSSFSSTAFSDENSPLTPSISNASGSEFENSTPNEELKYKTTGVRFYTRKTSNLSKDKFTKQSKPKGGIITPNFSPDSPSEERLYFYQNQKAGLSRVKGGIVTNQNVYYPSYNKK